MYTKKNKTTHSLSWVFTRKLKLFNIYLLNFPQLHDKFLACHLYCLIIFSLKNEDAFSFWNPVLPLHLDWFFSFCSRLQSTGKEPLSIRPFLNAHSLKSLMTTPSKTQILKNISLSWKYALLPYIHTEDSVNPLSFSFSTAAKNLRITSATQTL